MQITNNWEMRQKRTVLDGGRFLTVEYHTVELPDGRVIDDWAWVKTPDYVVVTIIDEQGNFVLLRQAKYGIDGLSLATVGGYIEPGEEPLLAAKRETLEEVGYEAPQWTNLGAYRVDPNRGAGMAYVFLATGAHKATEPNADDFEEQELVILARDQVKEAIFKGEFKALAWASSVALSLLYTT